MKTLIFKRIISILSMISVIVLVVLVMTDMTVDIFVIVMLNVILAMNIGIGMVDANN